MTASILLNRRDRTCSTRLGFAVGMVSMALVVSCSSSSTAPAQDESASSSESTSSEPASGALIPLDSAAMDKVVQEVAAAHKEIGMVVLIRTPQGNYVNTWGSVAEGAAEAPTLDTKVRIGSNTKTWTGTVILQMVQEGKLRIDDPVSKFRPDVPNGENITIGQLLDMRSGLFNYTRTLEVNKALDDTPQRLWTPEELVALGLSNPPDSAPGTEYHYSNTNTVLLGLIAEKLDGKPLAQVYQERLFDKLPLTGTSFPANTDTSIPDPFTRGYSYSGNVETLGEGNESLSPDRLAAIASGAVRPRDTTNDNPSWTWSAGQGISTANDMATFAKALVKGGLLDESTQKLRLDSVEPTDGPGSAGYGFGLAQMGPMFGHIGEMPGYNSFMGYDPTNDVTFIVWGNLAPGADGSAPASALAQLLVPHVYAGSSGDAAEDIDRIADETNDN